MWPATSVNGRPWPASASRVSSASTRSSESRNSPDRVGRVALVEVQRHAAEQVVAGDQQPPLGLVQADVRGRVAGRLDHLPRRRGRSRPTTPGTRSRSTTSSPAMPAARPRAAGRPSAAAAPRARRTGARPRSGARASPRASRRWRAGAHGGVHPDLAARRARGSRGAWPQWSACACVQTTSRTCSSCSPAWSSARSRCAIEPGSCMPVSTSTIPSPAASAQALQCGTPGQGSGSRRRQTPGSTRSPRPTSRFRVGLRIAAGR